MEGGNEVRERDSQRSKVYRAEGEAFGKNFWDARPAEPIERTRARACAILTSKAVEKRWPHVAKAWRDGRIAIDEAHGNQRRGLAWSHRVSLPDWTRKPTNWWVLHHELAHVIRARTDGRGAGHGWEFCDTYVFLVRHTHGEAEARALEASFRKHKVRFKAKRKLSPERLAQLRERGKQLAATRKAARPAPSCQACASPTVVRHTCGLRSLQNLLSF
jgi:hypothetical protein